MSREGHGAARRAGYFPRVVLATLVVTVLPGLVAAALQATATIHGWLPSAAIAVALSMALAAVGSLWWARRPASRDIVFADLMLWGWLRRVRTERRLASARGLLGRSGDLDPARKAALLERLSGALESRDLYTHGHSKRVTRHSYLIARQLGLPAADAARIRTAAALHDVGKMETPREVLNKPARLSDEEFATIKRHPVDGARMVEALGDEELTAMVRHHHERLDGSGYPVGLVGGAIPLGARVIAVADTFDALTSNRPYRTGCRHKKALDILRAEAGTQLDPDVVAAFLSYYSGRRALPWWSAVAEAPSRLASWMLGGIQGAMAAPVSGGVTSLGAAFLVGASLAGSPAQGEAAGTARASSDVSPAARAASVVHGAWRGMGDTPGPTRPGRTRSPRREGGTAHKRRPRPAGGERSLAAPQRGPVPSVAEVAEIPTYIATVPAGGGSAGGDSGPGDAGGGESGGGSDVEGPRLLDAPGDDGAETPRRGGGKRKDAAVRKDTAKRKDTEKRKGAAPPADRPNADARGLGRSKGRAPKEQTLPQAQRPKAELAPAEAPRAQPPQVEVPLPPVQPGGPPVQPGGPPGQPGGRPDHPSGPPDQLPSPQGP